MLLGVYRLLLYIYIRDSISSILKYVIKNVNFVNDEIIERYLVDCYNNK